MVNNELYILVIIVKYLIGSYVRTSVTNIQSVLIKK